MAPCSLLPLLLTLSTALQLHDLSTDHQDWDYKHGRRSQSPSCKWKCMQFTLQWPGGFCQSLYNESLCQIPPNINTWTIHGLWPQRVQRCCECWPLFLYDVQELEAELSERWPSLVKFKSSFQFWKDEWEKHGACAACVEELKGPRKYFQICLKLRQHFDIHRLLDDAGITPSCQRPYEVDEVHRVLTPLLGRKHELECVTDQQDRQVWFQVKTSLFPNLTIDCVHHRDADAMAAGSGRSYSRGHACPTDVPLYYLPIDHHHWGAEPVPDRPPPLGGGACT
uniref:Ribonuclease Oy-like n=2 Tax=Sphaeramia orbicularis TaxID=375764 RepID=A0A673A076_9TELE